MQRVDDEPATIRKRLRLFDQNAGELRRHYQAAAYYPIWAARSPEEVSEELLATLERTEATFPIAPSCGKTVETLFHAPAFSARPV